MLISESVIREVVRKTLILEEIENQGKNLITLKGKEGGLVGDFQLLGTVTGQPDRSTVVPNDFYIFLVPKQSTGGMPFSVQVSKEGPSLEDYFVGPGFGLNAVDAEVVDLFDNGHPIVVKDRQGTLKIKNVEDGAVSNFNLSILNSSSSKNLLCALPKYSKAITGIKKSKITDKTKTGFFGTSAKSLYSIFLDGKEYKAIGYYQDSDFKSNPTLEKFKTLVSITDEGRLSEMTHVAALLPNTMIDSKKGIRISPDEISVYNHDKDFKYDAGIINNQNTINDSIFKNLDLSKPSDLVVALVPMTADVKYNSEKTSKGGVSGADLLIEKLGFLGLVPGVGEVFDFAAGLVALTKDPPDKVLAALNFTAVIPVIGDLLKKSGLLRGVLSEYKSLDEILIELTKKADVEPIELLSDVDEAIVTAKKNISDPALDNMPDVQKARQEIGPLLTEIESIDPDEFKRRWDEAAKVRFTGEVENPDIKKLYDDLNTNIIDFDKKLSEIKKTPYVKEEIKDLIRKVPGDESKKILEIIEMLSDEAIEKFSQKIFASVADVYTPGYITPLRSVKSFDSARNVSEFYKDNKRNMQAIEYYSDTISTQKTKFETKIRKDPLVSRYRSWIKLKRDNPQRAEEITIEKYFGQFPELKTEKAVKEAVIKVEKEIESRLSIEIDYLQTKNNEFQDEFLKSLERSDFGVIIVSQLIRNTKNTVAEDQLRRLARARLTAIKIARKEAYQDVSGETLKDWHAVHYVGAFVSDSQLEGNAFGYFRNFLRSQGKGKTNFEMNAVGYNKENKNLADMLAYSRTNADTDLGKPNIGVVMDGKITSIFTDNADSTTFSDINKSDVLGAIPIQRRKDFEDVFTGSPGDLEEFTKLYRDKPGNSAYGDKSKVPFNVDRLKTALEGGEDPDNLIDLIDDSDIFQFDLDGYDQTVRAKKKWKYNETFIKDYQITNIIARWDVVVQKSIEIGKKLEEPQKKKILEDIAGLWADSKNNSTPILDKNFQEVTKDYWQTEVLDKIADGLEINKIIINESFLLTKSQLSRIIRELLIKEYVVPMGYSLKQWKKKKKKEKISNKDYADQTKGDKWKVVHGKSKGKIGKPINKSAKNLSYAKATKMHTAIELNEKIRDLLFDD